MTEFERGAKVLIRGTFREVASHGLAFISTVAGNIIVVHENDLDASRVEALARVMCEVDAVDPDAKASVGQPFLVSGGFVITGTPFEAWRLYAKYAGALIDKGLA